MPNKKFDVLVVGELNVDLILNHIDSFPEMGKEKLAQKMDLTLGSSSAIFASNLSTLGTKVAFLGKIGNDAFGDLTLSTLKEKKVDTGLIIRDSSVNTGATIVLNYDEDRAMVTYPGAMNELRIDEIRDEALQSARHLHFSSLYLQPGIKPDIGELFRRAKAAGLTTSLDMQWDPSERWDFDYKNVLPLTDVFLPNEQELFFLTGSDTVAEGLQKLASFANIVAVKRGSKGSLIWTKETEILKDAFLNRNVVDAIGAGDSFNAGFIHKFMQGAVLSECQLYGNLMGAINTTAAGGTTAFTSPAAIAATANEYFGVQIL